MPDLNEQETDFSRLIQGLPVDDAPRSEHRDALRERVLAAFGASANLDARPRWKRAWSQGRELMKRPLPRLVAVATACAVIAAVWLFVPGRQSTAQAFNKLADTLVAAKSARFDMEVAAEGQPKQIARAYYLAPGRFRQELKFMNVVNITDLPAGKMISVVPATKQVMVMNLKGEPKGKKFESEFDRLRELLSNSHSAKDAQYEKLGEKEIEGKRVVGFRYDSPLASVTLWGDPSTGYPVRIDTTWSGIPRTEVTMTHFEINVDLKPSLFDMTPPVGYAVQSIDVDLANKSEQGLINAFKTATELGDGEFPDSLDAMGITKLVTKAAFKVASKAGKQPSDEFVQKLMKSSMTMGMGIQFALELPQSTDAHYAGRGVKLNTASRPVFWYKPEGTSSYRVIFADLSVTNENVAPQVPGAQRIAKAANAAKPAGK